MKTIKAIIIDDEHHAQTVLEELLNRSTESIDILAKCNGLIEGIDCIERLKPNLVFLDVQMPNYAGYEILNFIDNIDFEIIFVTAYDQYAIKAFEVNAIDYLLKPVDRKKLDAALQKFARTIDTKHTIEKYNMLANSFQKNKPNHLIIPELNNRRIVNIDDILAFEASGAYTIIHLNNMKNIFTSKNLKYFQSRIEHTGQFFRCHRSWLVQLSKISEFNRTKGTLSIEGSKLDIKISRNVYQDFEDALFQTKKE